MSSQEQRTEVELAIEDGVARLSLQAPERRNAITIEMASQLVAAADRVDADSSVAAVVITAVGEAFCAGADRKLLAQIAENPVAADSYEALGLVYESFSRLQSIKAPTIAAIRGPAVGAGLNLALSTDLRIVATDAIFRSGFLPIGVHPGGGHFTLLSRLGGREAAVAMGLFSRPVTGERAAELGLAWEALPESEVEGRALELAQSVSKDAALSRATIASFRAQAGAGRPEVERGLRIELGPQLWSFYRSDQLRRG